MRDNEKIIVGKGGDSPGLDCITCTGRIAATVSLNEGESVYGIQFTPYDNTVTAGLRSGHIKHYFHNQENDELVELATFDQGCPVVSVTRDGGHIYSAGSDGTILSLKTDTYKEKVIACDYKFISVEPLPDHKLVGLTDKGEVVFLNEHHEMTGCIKGPPPCGPLSLVRMLFWKKKNILVYPGAEGVLVGVSLEEYSIQTTKAHNGGFVALFTDGNDLYTAGLKDGKLNKWLGRDDWISLDCPAGIISGCCHCIEGGGVGLIDISGNLYLCQVGDRLDVFCSKEGQWRCFMQASGIEHADLYDYRRQVKVENLQERIWANINNGNVDQNDSHYNELQKMGCHKSTLALKAKQYQIYGETGDEFMTRHQLCQMSSEGQLEATFLQRYLAVTLDTGLVGLAGDIVNRYRNILDTDIVEYMSGLVKAGPVMFDASGWNLNELSRLWSFVGCAVTGEFLLERGTPLPVPIPDGFIDSLICFMPQHSKHHIIKNKLLGQEGYFNVELLLFNDMEKEVSSIQIVPGLLCEDSALSWVMLAVINNTASVDIGVHNMTVAKTLNKFSGRLFDVVDRDVIDNIKIAVIKTLNERVYSNGKL